MDTQLINKQIYLSRWAEMIHTCKSSGLTTVEWCRQNDIGIKTYYYRYKRVKEAALESSCFAEITAQRASVTDIEEEKEIEHVFIPQMTVEYNGGILGITEKTPKSLIIKMMEILKDA